MPRKLGILAGAGDLPKRIIHSCRATGRDVFVIAFNGQTFPETVSDVDHQWVRMGASGAAIKALKNAGVEDLVMAGGVRRPSLASLMPDFRTIRFLIKAGFSSGDDRLLRAIVHELEAQEGFNIVGVDSLLPDEVASAGVLGTHIPDDQARKDLVCAARAAREAGALDISQGAVAQLGAVLAVEDASGTDALLERAAKLKGDGPGGVLVKVKKPGQEHRVDLPAIGVSTVRAAAAAGLRGIGLEAGGALIIDPPAVIEAADKAGLFIIGIDALGQ
ncbi:MAG: UDP-2,3-diacylglucosamine diphosphatase LpxI [Rhodospirillales bacterium]|nr:UDP-2,3-diacylglucosamine diphosphatase LpxI [Rhodospirillales bacterium]